MPQFERQIAHLQWARSSFLRPHSSITSARTAIATAATQGHLGLLVNRVVVKLIHRLLGPLLQEFGYGLRRHGQQLRLLKKNNIHPPILCWSSPVVSQNAKAGRTRGRHRRCSEYGGDMQPAN